MTDEKYPKFISTHPCGEDKLLGKSQERIAEAVKNHILNEESKLEELKKTNVETKDCLPHIIGLEGSWGSGKSNLIRILNQKEFLKDTHYIFEYDTWGHQEDLQRRSFLETLTDELVKGGENHEELLPEKCSIENSNGDLESWEDKLKNLLARKRKVNTIKVPKLSFAIVLSIILMVITPITSNIKDHEYINPGTRVLIFYLPVIIVCIYALYLLFVKKTKITELFFIYSGDKVEDEIKETISEKKPSVTEFNKWMHDLSKDLNKKLIIVYDNMDRLPAIKVKELWSSIHTFFAEEFYRKIWVIIPFDREHLANAFANEDGKENQEAKALTNHFINKTFPIIYRVAEPIISDLKNVFIEYYNEAFGSKSIQKEEKDKILRIFMIIKKNPSIRDVIVFINELVSLKLTWKDEISVFYLSVFVLTKDKILYQREIVSETEDKKTNRKQSIAEVILSKEYYKDISTFLTDEDELLENISAIVFNVNKEDAKQIALTLYLEEIFKSEDNERDINSISKHKYFFEVLHDVVVDIDPIFIDNVINEVYGLDNNDLGEIWNKLTSIKIKQPLQSLKFETTHRNLLERGSGNNKESVVKYLCEAFQNFEEITGVGYFKALSELDTFVKKLGIKIDMKSNLRNKEVSPGIFINYVESAKGEFEKYQLVCNETELNKYLINSLPVDLNFTTFFDFIKNSYDLNDFYNELEGKYSDSVNADNFYFLNYVYKSLSEDKPLKVLLNSNQVVALKGTIKDKRLPGYYDLEAMAIANNQLSTININDQNDIIEIAKRIEYYKTMGELLILSLSWNKANLNKVLLELLENPIDQQKIEVEEILPRFSDIVMKLDVEPIVLIERLNDCFKREDTNINKDNIQPIVASANFYSYSVKDKTDLTKYIHEVLLSRISEIDKEILFQNRTQPSYYWIESICYLIEGGVINKLPDNLIILGEMVLKQLAQDGIKPNDNIEVIIKKIPSSSLTSTIKDIADEFYKKTPAIDVNKFKYFEPYFRERNRIKEKEDDFVRTILDSVIENSDCLSLILKNSKFYADTVKKAGEDAESFKLKLKTLLKSQASDQLIKFAKMIGVELDETTENE